MSASTCTATSRPEAEVAVAEGLRPLTLLLGGAALWALCLLILALGGLGTNFPPPTVAAAPPPLPNVAMARAESASVPTRSMRWSPRPLMNGTSQAGRNPVASEANASELDVTLTSVSITPSMKLAILTDNKDGGSRRVRLGEAVEGSGWRLVALEPRRAILEGATGQRAGVAGIRWPQRRSADPGRGDRPGGGRPGPHRARCRPAPPPPKPAVAQNVAPPRPRHRNQCNDPGTTGRSNPPTLEARRAQMRAEAATDAAKR